MEYRSDFVILHPTDPARGNGRILYEVNNRGRIMLFANMCAGAAGNTPQTAADLGNAFPLRLGFTLVWSGWDAGAPKATGLSLDAPVASDGEHRSCGASARSSCPAPGSACCRRSGCRTRPPAGMRR